MVEAAGTGGVEKGKCDNKGSAMSSSLTALVDFWHEIVSHNMFVSSFVAGDEVRGRAESRGKIKED